MDKRIFANLQWYFAAKKIKGKHKNRLTGEVQTKKIFMWIQKLKKAHTTTSNNYNRLESNELVEYSDYEQPWKPNNRASGHYTGLKTGVHNQTNNRNEIKVQVADGTKSNQIQEGKAPFDGLPKEAADVHIFPHIPNYQIFGIILPKMA